MRASVAGLETAAPLGERLPAVMQEDDFTMRFVSAFDVAFAPVLATLDNLAAYVDPHLAPVDFLDWLADWVGVEFGPARDIASRRDAVAGAVATFRRDGTVQGMREAVELATGGAVEVEDSGAVVWSATTGATGLPGSAAPAVHVRVAVDEPATVDPLRLATLVGYLKPAHVAHTVEVVSR